MRSLTARRSLGDMRSAYPTGRAEPPTGEGPARAGPSVPSTEAQILLVVLLVVRFFVTRVAAFLAVDFFAPVLLGVTFFCGTVFTPSGRLWFESGAPR